MHSCPASILSKPEVKMRDDAITKMASLGGIARSKSLTPDQRSEIARAAVEARWSKAGKKLTFRATHTGELKIGEVSIPCAVLEDGTRVLWQQGFLRAIGRTGKAAASAVT